MNLMTWLTKRPDTQELFDYSSILIRVEQLERQIHDQCLEKNFSSVPALADELIEQAVLLKKWVKTQK
jgi:hypothetical protein